MNEDSATLLRAIRGPVFMIAAGTLFALDQFAVLSFQKSWPLLLIVAGVLNLGYWTKRNQP